MTPTTNETTITSIHGTMLQMDQCGVLLTGAPGIGKSQLALTLIDRGHQLISDDIVDLQQQDHQLAASCPSFMLNFLMVKGLGIINISDLYGRETVNTKQKLDLIIELRPLSEMPPIMDPLTPPQQVQKLLGITIPLYFAPSQATVHLAVFTETLVRTHLLKKLGHDASCDFRLQHREMMH